MGLGGAGDDDGGAPRGVQVGDPDQAGREGGGGGAAAAAAAATIATTAEPGA